MLMTMMTTTIGWLQMQMARRPRLSERGEVPSWIIITGIMAILAIVVGFVIFHAVSTSASTISKCIAGPNGLPNSSCQTP